MVTSNKAGVSKIKNNLEKVSQVTKNSQNLNLQNGELRNSWIVSGGGVGVECMMT